MCILIEILINFPEIMLLFSTKVGSVLNVSHVMIEAASVRTLHRINIQIILMGVIPLSFYHSLCEALSSI